VLKSNIQVIVMTLISADSTDSRDISIQICVSNLTPITFCVSFVYRKVTTDWIDETFWCYWIEISLGWKRQQFGTALLYTLCVL